MIRRPFFSKFLLCALLLTGASQAKADESLKDPAKVRALTTDEQKHFGPKSSGVQYDSRMIRAMEIAKKRAQPKMTWYCWKYVKDALLASGVIKTRPTSLWACNAGKELCEKYGFVELSKVHDPRKAPVGAVVVYAGDDGGHVEMRTQSGFVSDFISPTPYPRPLVGVFVKPVRS